MEEENVNDFIDEELKKQIKKDMAMKKAVEFIVEARAKIVLIRN